jgi:PAS domain S-box-containing protein
MSLTLRFGFIAIGLAIAAVVAISYLFDLERTAAIHDKERDHQRFHANHIAEILEQHINQLKRDALLLAKIPPMQLIKATLARYPTLPHDAEQLKIWYERVGELYHALAHTRPEYLQLRLIAFTPEGPELLRVERRGADFVIVPREDLQRKGHRDYVRESAELKLGEVKLSRINLNRDRGAIPQPEIATVRAVTPVHAPDGRLFALIVINLNMDYVFDLMGEMVPEGGEYFVVDDTGHFLRHPDPLKAMSFDRDSDYRLADEFPEIARPLTNLAPRQSLSFSQGAEETGRLNALAIRRPFAFSEEDIRNLLYIVTVSDDATDREIYQARKESYLKIGLLLVVMVILIVVVIHRLTRSLRDLVKVSHAVSQGDYGVEIPNALGRDMGLLSSALQHMTRTLQQREKQLISLNQTLEQQVAERTQALEASRAALHREQLMLHSILDHVGDGVVAVDNDGRLLLWNRSAEAILGDCPADLRLQDWPERFGLYRAPDAALLTVEELPLMRALQGETVRQKELFIRNGETPSGRWVSMFSRPLNADQANPQGAVTVLVDIEEHRQIREQMDAESIELAKIGRLTLIGQIIDTIAHRLSQPLAAIANYSGAAIQMQSSNSLDTERLKEVLNLISQQAERGGACLGDLRALRTRGSQPAARVDLNTIIESAHQLLKDQLQRHQVTCEWNLQPHLPTIIGKRVALQQAVVHLLLNSMESPGSMVCSHPTANTVSM